MSVEKALLIDYEYCLGCLECEAVCRAEHGYPDDVSGVEVVKLGPWKLRDGFWQYDFVAIPTDWCDLCAERANRGKRPACVKHCPYSVIVSGDVDELIDYLREKPKMLLFTPKGTGAEFNSNAVSAM